MMRTVWTAGMAEGQRIGGKSGDAHWIMNPTDGNKSMLFGNRRGQGPKMEGGASIVRAPLRVSTVLIFFLGIGAAAGGAETMAPSAERVHAVAEVAASHLRLMCPETFGYARGSGYRDGMNALSEACLKEFEARPVAEQWQVCHELPGMCEEPK